jgi:hypothetical protein
MLELGHDAPFAGYMAFKANIATASIIFVESQGIFRHVYLVVCIS